MRARACAVCRALAWHRWAAGRDADGGCAFLRKKNLSVGHSHEHYCERAVSFAYVGHTHRSLIFAIVAIAIELAAAIYRAGRRRGQCDVGAQHQCLLRPFRCVSAEAPRSALFGIGGDRSVRRILTLRSHLGRGQESCQNYR